MSVKNSTYGALKIVLKRVLRNSTSRVLKRVLKIALQRMLKRVLKIALQRVLKRVLIAFQRVLKSVKEC